MARSKKRRGNRARGTTRVRTRIKVGDTVYVIAGKEKGKTGKVLKVLYEEGRAIVEKLNLIKRHMRPTPKDPAGGIVEKEAPIHLSNLMLYEPATGRPTRVGMRTLATGEKVRYSKRTGEEI